MIEVKQGETVPVSFPFSGRGHSEIYRRAARDAGLSAETVSAIELKAEKDWKRRLRRLGARRTKRCLVD